MKTLASQLATAVQDSDKEAEIRELTTEELQMIAGARWVEGRSTGINGNGVISQDIYNVWI